MNTLRTGMLLAALTALFIGVGFLIGGTGGAVIAFVIAAGMNVFSYWNADKLVLSMNRAREVDEKSAPEFYGLVRDLAHRANLPMPRVFIADNPQPNAFATGRNPEHAAVCATSGLLQMLDRDEIAGVMSHELGHVRNHDTLTMTITATLAGAISMLANFGLFFGGFGLGGNRNNPLGFVGILIAAMVAPVAAMMVQMAISRTREYSADRAGAEISGRPDALASALAKIDNAARRIPNPAAAQNPAAAHLFIVNPLSGTRMDNLFSTHPATDNRIAALTAMAREFGARPASPTAGQTVGTFIDRPKVEVPRIGTTGRQHGPWG